MWQDYVMAGVGLAFGYSLIPQVYRICKLKTASQFSWQTSVITAIGLWVFGATMLTLEMYFTACANIVTATCWTLIVLAKIRYRGK